MQTPTAQVGSVMGQNSLTGPPPVHRTGVVVNNGLCRAIADSAIDKEYIYKLEDPQSHVRYTVISLGKCRTLPNQKDLTTLDSLFKLAPANRPRRTTRLEIAVAVASSHFQLHTSAWLKAQWTKADIIFVVENDVAMVDQPYLTKQLEDSAAVTATISRNDWSFRTLRIMLLELCFGISLGESLVGQRYLSGNRIPDSYHRLAAAAEWSEEVDTEAGPGYAQAVGWCLGKRKINGNDKAWRQEFYQRVVEPLQKCYEDLKSS